MSKSEPSVKIEIITPAIAKEMMKRNPRNRNVIQGSLNHYIRQINEGQWKLNGDTIRFDTDDNLMDGQHRLLAIIETGISMKCMIARNLNKDAMPTIDTGRMRTVADHLKLQHRFETSNYASVAAAIVILSRFEGRKYIERKGQRLTPAEAIAFLEQNGAMLKSVDATGPELFKMLTPSVTIAMHYLFCKIDRFRAEEFFEKLKSGENLGKTSPILKLRTELLGRQRGSDKRRGIANKRAYIYYMVSAFEAFLSGRKIDGFEKLTVESVIELPKRGGG